MIKLERTHVVGLEPALRGARNPMNSWAKSDSHQCGSGDCDICIDYENCPYDHCPDLFIVGPNDHDLAMRLRNAGTDHRKYMRMIVVYVDVTAPLFWWKEFDTYKVGTVANSCSTMHKIHAKEFVLDDFTHENLRPRALNILMETIKELNYWRDIFLNGGTDDSDGTVRVFEPKDKEAWRQMIELLPSSYNQMRTLMFSYEVLANIHKSRRNHKLIEWHKFCDFIEQLPYSEFITGKVSENGSQT